MQLEGGECGGLEEQKEAGGQSPEGDRRRKLEMRPENLGGWIMPDLKAMARIVFMIIH